MRRLTVNGKAKTLLLIVSLAFNFGVCVALAVQQRGEERWKPRFGDGRHHREWLSNRLNLSADQTAVVAASKEKLFEGLRGLRSEMVAESEMLADLLIAPEPDMDAVSAQVEKVAAIRNRIQWRMIDHFLNIRETLQPEQLEAFKGFVRRHISGPGRGGRFGGKRSGHGEWEPRQQPHRDGLRSGFGEEAANEKGDGG